jgi:hypothetical protein
MTSNAARSSRPAWSTSAIVALPVLLAGLSGCSGSNSSSPSALVPGPGSTPTAIGRGQAAPEIRLTIESVTGASGADKTFQIGEQVSVRFSMRKTDGSPWRANEMSLGRILISGPSYNYQRVVPELDDVFARAVANADGSYTYTFANGLPAVYAAPLNDTEAFGATDGELAGQALVAGTYTVGLYVAWSYTIEDQGFRQVGNATGDFLFGGATEVAPREVVKQENCNQCHETLQAHGGVRRDVRLCILCHTSGSEDRNNPDVAGGTPGASIDFRVMIHKIHNGARLPSVLGVATKPDGSRNYTATPKKYELVGFRDRVHDYSQVVFPVWPGALVATPRDLGWKNIGTAAQALEDRIRTGVTGCNSCHGDPDGSGPLTAPAQGGLAETQPSRRACGSCHDDVDWGHPYTANGSTMPAQNNDASCLLCHGVTATALAPDKAHLHPMLDLSFNPGLRFDLRAVREAGVANNDGTIDPGEKVELEFAITDDAGNPVDPSAVASISAVVSGPTTNSNLLLNASVPVAAVTGSPPYRELLPELVYQEYVGTSTSTTGDEFDTARSPHWDIAGAVTTLWVETESTRASALRVDARPPQNWLDVADGSKFKRNDYVRIDDMEVEYLQIQHVEGNRLWLSSPYTPGYPASITRTHVAGTLLSTVKLQQKRNGTDYSLDKSIGRIKELVEFGAGAAVVVSYTTDWVVPQRYPLALNDTPTLGEASGKWAGKALVDGTYAVTLWGVRNLTLSLFGEDNAYRGTAPGARKEFLFGSATKLRPYELIASGASCNACHQELWFHGAGRRGFDTCIACHGTAGAEDRTQYVAANAPATAGLSVNFRSMLHKIHMGEELANASTYTVLGFGSGWPNNFTPHSYGEVVFPAMPGGPRHCAKCHGKDNTAWFEPAVRNHPTAQLLPTRGWEIACGACHDGDAAQAHIAVQTSAAGVESCAVCHGPGKEWHVQRMHEVR